MENKINKDKYHFFFLAISLLMFLGNIITSLFSELTFDESYYWMFSNNLDFGYFDHPPMVALSIFLGKSVFCGVFGVRVMSQLYFLGSLWILYLTLEKKQSFWWISFLSICFPLIGFSGVFALPDSSIMFFCSLFFLFLKKYLEEESLLSIFGLAISIAVMFYSKYHGLLIILLTVCGKPALLKKKSFYAIALLVLVFFLPHMIWQYKHEFVSFKFHLFGRKEKHFSIANIGDYIGGQWLLCGFLSFIYFCKTLWKKRVMNAYENILWFNSIGFLIFLFFMSFRNQMEANWTVTCGLAFILLIAPRIQEKKHFIILTAPMIVLFFGARLLILNPNWYDEKESYQNRMHEILGWENQKIPSVLDTCENLPIVTESYQIAAKLAFYLNRPQIPSLHLTSRKSQYSFWNFEKNISKDTPICFLTPKKNINTDDIVHTYYKDPIYIKKGTTLSELAQKYGTTYEEIIRN